ncbi:MAG TPA: hypothetical protein VFH07_05690 [Chitinophagaceae bacterium]|nr:hypothetical protein [Chitinophagaceae bacterium]
MPLLVFDIPRRQGGTKKHMATPCLSVHFVPLWFKKLNKEPTAQEGDARNAE